MSDFKVLDALRFLYAYYRRAQIEGGVSIPYPFGPAWDYIRVSTMSFKDDKDIIDWISSVHGCQGFIYYVHKIHTTS